ncbi:Helix-turn-helix type 11 domain protein [Ammonifex degensii KC4]|uniref:Helix-turn-helix type 11 domain protein n=1 Tax=Ammonifex degensii (strain DSM 10501 / KC4) TaxID=429009 RepID=C9R988_AMMDK|nr:WYL domain-containing protein [Ammonifex degensii]ACX52867.1 Helix-turn-helix type 11 domain protein [Ammonifex degensii KC4]
MQGTGLKTFGAGRIEETKRLGRILEMVCLIASRPRHYRRSDLARRFEVSERTIQKDLDIIRHALRLELRHSPRGYYFERVPTLPVLQFTFGEALSLLLALQAARHQLGSEFGDLASALRRLTSLFPPEFESLLHRQAGLLPSSGRKQHRQHLLLLLNQALLHRRKVKMVYSTHSRGGARSERVVHPYCLLPYVRSWYLIAYCERRQETLFFKLDRIEQAFLLDEYYPFPEDFDLAAYLGPTWGIMRGAAGEPVEVVLRFTPEAGRRVAEEDWHPSQQVEELGDGSVLFKLRVAVTPEFVSWLLYYGSQVEVLAPPELRGRLAEEHLKAAEVNGKKFSDHFFGENHRVPTGRV